MGDVLDLHKVQAGRMELEYHEFRVDAIVNTSISQVKAAAIAKQITITASIAADVPHKLLGDSGRLTQMLSNYLSNAVKFTPPFQGRVDVYVHSAPTTSHDRRRLRFIVRDNGIGLMETEIPRLFRSYQQASASVARMHGGTGLVRTGTCSYHDSHLCVVDKDQALDLGRHIFLHRSPSHTTVVGICLVSCRTSCFTCLILASSHAGFDHHSRIE